MNPPPLSDRSLWRSVFSVASIFEPQLTEFEVTDDITGATVLDDITSAIVIILASIELGGLNVLDDITQAIIIDDLTPQQQVIVD